MFVADLYKVRNTVSATFYLRGCGFCAIRKTTAAMHIIKFRSKDHKEYPLKKPQLESGVSLIFF